MGRGGGWWWDGSPINLTLARELGEVSKNGYGSPSVHTCVGKAAARMLAEAATELPLANDNSSKTKRVTK